MFIPSLWGGRGGFKNKKTNNETEYLERDTNDTWHKRLPEVAFSIHFKFHTRTLKGNKANASTLFCSGSLYQLECEIDDWSNECSHNGGTLG